jgi:hypothetical protein
MTAWDHATKICGHCDDCAWSIEKIALLSACEHLEAKMPEHASYSLARSSFVRRVPSFNVGNFLLLRPYHCEHGPKVPVTPEYIVVQRVLQKRKG